MPGEVLRFERRPKGTASTQQALTAASQLIADPGTPLKASIGSRHEDWQALAWQFYDQVGEFRYYVGWRASACSRTRLIASAVDPQTGRPTGGIIDTDPNRRQVQEIVRAIAGGPQGQAQLIKRVVESLSVVGEVWVAILDTGEPDLPDDTKQMTWHVVTRDEIKKGVRGTTEIELPDESRHVYNPNVDSCIRIWFPRARRAHEADSPVRACLSSLHEIVRTTKTISNASKSRLIGNGILMLPEEMSLPATGGPTSDKTDLTDQTQLTGVSAVKELQDLIWQIANTAWDDDDSMAALIPLLVTVKGELIQKVNHIKFDNQVTNISINVRNDAISRLAMGLDVSPERLLGLGSNSNHWTAWQIGDEDVQLHVVPPMDLLCHALVQNYFNFMLVKHNIDPQRYTLTFDASGLTADPDKSNVANMAYSQGAINGEAFIEYLGLPSGSGYDFATTEGWVQWARDLVSRQPDMVGTFAPWLNVAPGLPPLDLAQIPGPQQEPKPAEPDKSQPEPDSEQRANRGRSAIAASMGPPSARAVALVERMLVTKALETSGRRRRRRSDYERLRNVPLRETHRYMPAMLSEEVPAAVEGWDSALSDDYIASLIEGLGLETEDLRAAAYAIIKRELTSEVVEGDVE